MLKAVQLAPQLALRFLCLVYKLQGLHTGNIFHTPGIYVPHRANNTCEFNPEPREYMLTLDVSSWTQQQQQQRSAVDDAIARRRAKLRRLQEKARGVRSTHSMNMKKQSCDPSPASSRSFAPWVLVV